MISGSVAPLLGWGWWGGYRKETGERLREGQKGRKSRSVIDYKFTLQSVQKDDGVGGDKGERLKTKRS